MGKIRTPLWDNLKFILIVLVVLGHFINIRDSVTYHSIFIIRDREDEADREVMEEENESIYIFS